jgi:hypothetical protein
MKILLSVLFTTAIAMTAVGQSYTSLTVGTGNTTQSKSATIGSSNNISNASAANSLLMGDSNWVNSPSGTNLLAGYANGISGGSNASMLSGAYNTGNGVLASAALGWGNQIVNASNCFAVGFGNYATNWGQFLLGSGLIGGSVGDTSNNPTVVVGSYNVDKADQRFVVGMGTGVGNDANTRRNALEVSKTGQITILRQGDIGMGRFGNSGDQ